VPNTIDGAILFDERLGVVAIGGPLISIIDVR